MCINIYNSLIGDSIIATCANNQHHVYDQPNASCYQYDTHEPVYPHLIHPPIGRNSSLPIIRACRRIHGSLTSPTIDVLTVSWLSSQLHPVARTRANGRRNTSRPSVGCNFKNSLTQLPQQGNKCVGQATRRQNRPRWVVSAGGLRGSDGWVRLKSASNRQ